MIVVYKETEPNKNDPFDMSERTMLYMKEYGSVSTEVELIRIEYGRESELINGKVDDSVCLVYDGYRLYIVRVRV